MAEPLKVRGWGYISRINMLRALDDRTRTWPVRKAMLRAIRRALPGLHHSSRWGVHLSPIFPIEVRGFTYYVNHLETFGISRWLLSGGDYCAEEVDALQSVLRPGDVFVDVGANIGFFVPIASKAVGQTGRVVAIEPTPAHLDLMRRTIRANQLANVTVIPAAVGDHEGQITLYQSAVNTGDNHTYPRPGDADGLTVPLVTIDAALAQLGIKRVDVMMMDIQGAEGFALRGMTQTWARNLDLLLLCEFWPGAQQQAGDNPVETLRCFLADGRSVYAETRREPSSPDRSSRTVAATPITATQLAAELIAEDQWVNLVVTRRMPFPTQRYQIVSS
jgi:FkbM family methyltransferase